ncbi:LuxR C-terminal-related transcriptional regulator [Azospirillum rugosum]|uniref:DNA-binding NarL/FixJ family response regulator n=1 Tax=Azospirillum rugosum TaxID=416170 RepID=A0ABS4SSB4_9PROT|nr:response regulator transcription factor [Azospirillum rugosum]MBP2295455.1 DNA-binding NarL/FixJ family response regulator [Azospirillum rugosum]MDQ0528334.1 DNA-binding NarL/FixJ family response regulator [Azospirillum rugosum]
MNHRFGIDPIRTSTIQRKVVPGTGGPRILVADDHALMRHGLALAIKVRFPGASVIEAGSLAEAIAKARGADDLSAVLFDLQMGDTDGLAGVETMLRVLDGVPLVVVSGTLDSAMVSACIRAGARGFLPKGCDVAVLDHALPVVIAGGIYAPLPQGVAPAQPLSPSAVGEESGARMVEELTERQREVLRLLLRGHSNKEIARSLGVLEGTVKVHLRSIMQRLRVRNRTQLALIASKSGLA